MSVVTTIVPLFLLIVLGFVSIRAGYIAAGHIRPVGDFVIKVALPALIFQAVTSLPLAEALDWRFIGAYGAGSMAAFAVGLVVARRAMGQGPAPAGIVALGMSGSNSGFMGYPIALSVVGAGAGPLLAQCMVVENVLIIPLALALAEGAGRGRGWRALVQALRGLVSNPIIMALIAALAVSATGLRLPAMLDEAIGMLARIAPPIALFVLGGTVAALPMAGVRAPAAAIVAGKLVLHPLAVLAALWAMPGIEPWMLVGGVIFAAAPMLSIYPLFGQRAGIEMLTATALLIAVLASFVTMTLWIAGMTALVGL
jgi:malonate transporter and related proteins